MLFVGISDIEISEITQSILEDTPNDIVALFDFETMKWIEQDYVTFPIINDFDSYAHDFSCAVYHDKSSTRNVLIQHY